MSIELSSFASRLGALFTAYTSTCIFEATISKVIEVRETARFAAWLASLRDGRARAKIAARVQRLRFGNPGDVRPVGEGVSEMRIHSGPGYRVYYAQRDAVLVILLCGGDKSTQTSDIEAAKQLAREIA